MPRGDDFVNLVELTQPAVEPVTLAAARQQVRVDADMTVDDNLLTALIVAARDYCENALSRAFVQRTFELRMNRFPFNVPIVMFPYICLELLPNQIYGMIPIPKPPLVSINYIRYVDPGGNLQTLSPSAYIVETMGKFQGVVVPAYGTTFPPTRIQLSSVQVGFTAGYSADASAVPIGVQQAMLMLVDHWYKNRGAASVSSNLPIPFGVDALLAPYQWGFYG